MKGNVFDVGPTVLSLIGTDTKGLGLSGNLFSKRVCRHKILMKLSH